MPSTSQILTNVEQRCHGWYRNGTRGILPVLNEIHRYMKAHDCENNEVITAATGLCPILATTAGTYQYNLPSDCRRLYQALILADQLGYDEYGHYEEYSWRGRSWYIVPVAGRPRTRNASPSLTFRSDPGTTTSKYYTRYYVIPREILSPAIQLDVQEEFHTLVEDGVVARIRMSQYGESDPWDMWRNRVMEEYWYEEAKSTEAPSMSKTWQF